LAIAESYLFEWFTQQVSGTISDTEQNVLETFTEILNELPKDEVKSAFCVGRKHVNGPRIVEENSVQATESSAILMSPRLIHEYDTENFLNTLCMLHRFGHSYIVMRALAALGAIWPFS
jgi:hypothetical protein